MRKRYRTFFLRLAYTESILTDVGEKASIKNIRYVWGFAKEDFYASLQDAVDDGEIPADRYNLRRTPNHNRQAVS